MEVALEFYPVELERPWTREFMDKIMGHVRSQLAVSFTLSGCETFCKSLKLKEMMKDKNYQLERLPTETLCTMILAAAGQGKYSSSRMRLGP